MELRRHNPVVIGSETYLTASISRGIAYANGRGAVSISTIFFPIRIDQQVVISVIATLPTSAKSAALPSVPRPHLIHVSGGKPETFSNCALEKSRSPLGITLRVASVSRITH